MNVESQKLEQFQEKPKKEFEIDYETFDPEAELKNLRKGDKETRTERLEKYKEELIRQKEGIAEIQINLEKQIRENPDLSQEKLMETVSAKAPEHKLSKNQLTLFQETLNRYVARHQAVREARKQYPHDKELFKACFGKKPEGMIEVIEGPITLHFRCYDLKDYAWIDLKKFFAPIRKQKITKSELELASRSGARMISDCLIPSLQNIITAEQTKGEPRESRRAAWNFRHEERHAISKLFRDQQFRNAISNIIELFGKEAVREEMKKELKNEKGSKLLIEYLRGGKEIFKNWAKDEVLALYAFRDKEGAYYPKDILELLLRSGRKGGLYDFFKENEEDLKEDIKEKLTSKIYRKNKKAIESIFKQVFADEYRQEIIGAIDSIEELEKMGKSRNEIIYLLTTEPLSRWENLVKRMKETKK